MVSFILIICTISPVTFGQIIFRLLDPNNPDSRYGKSPYSGPPFYYFGSTLYFYRIANSLYNPYLSYVDAAFGSWNNAGQVQFERRATGLPLAAEAQDYSDFGPAWCFPGIDESTDEIIPSNGSIVLNTNCTWSSNQQALDDIPPILDVQSMVTHEAGHIMGLAHPLIDSYIHDDTAASMAGGDNEYFDNSLECRSLESNDIYGTQFLQLRFPTLYSNLQSALNKAEEIGIGYVYIMSDYTLTNNITVPLGANLVIKSGKTLEIQDYVITFNGGAIIIESNAKLSPDIRLQSGSTLIGLYPNIPSAFNAASSGQWVHIRGTYTFNDHFTIPSSKVLKTESGTQMNFVSGKYLYVDGILNVLGTSANHVTFTRSGSSGTWGGIRFRSGSSGTIQYANISYATYGVHLTSSGSVANVQHCNFTQNTYGARVDYSDNTQFSNCNFQNNTYGIYPYYANCDIEDNTFSNNYRGIHTYRCSPALNDNEINNNTNAGIYAGTYSSPQLWTICPYGSGNVNNYIHHNPTGVYCSSSATPNLGIYINRGSAAMGGFNYFLSNSSYDVKNYNSSDTIRAEVNWWEPSAKIYGSVDLSPDAEGLGFYLPKPAVAGKPDDSASELLRSAQILELDSAYTKAIVQYKQIIDQYSEAGIVGAALTGVERCHHKLKSETELISYLDKLRDAYPKQFTGALALYFSGGVYARSSDYQAALNRLEEAEAVFRSLPGFPEETAWVMFDQGQICEMLDAANDGTQKLTRAGDIYKNILKDFPDTEAAAQLKDLVEFDKPPESSAVVIKNTTLLPAYPNPFNESTQIVFQINETSPVKIIIYDLLGRQVRTLVNRRISAGIHEIQWNGKDESGHPLSSGIYLCQLLSGDKRQTIKVLMAK